MGQSTINGGDVEHLISDIEGARAPSRTLDARYHCIVGDFRPYARNKADEDLPIWAEPIPNGLGGVRPHVGDMHFYEEAPAYTSSIDASVKAYKRFYDHPYMVMCDPIENSAMACFGPNAASGYPLSMAEHVCKPPQPAMAFMLATLYAIIARKQKD